VLPEVRARRASRLPFLRGAAGGGGRRGPARRALAQTASAPRGWFVAVIEGIGRMRLQGGGCPPAVIGRPPGAASRAFTCGNFDSPESAATFGQEARARRYRDDRRTADWGLVDGAGSPRHRSSQGERGLVEAGFGVIPRRRGAPPCRCRAGRLRDVDVVLQGVRGRGDEDASRGCSALPGPVLGIAPDAMGPSGARRKCRRRCRHHIARASSDEEISRRFTELDKSAIFIPRQDDLLIGTASLSDEQRFLFFVMFLVTYGRT